MNVLGREDTMLAHTAVTVTAQHDLTCHVRRDVKAGANGANISPTYLDMTSNLVKLKTISLILLANISPTFLTSNPSANRTNMLVPFAPTLIYRTVSIMSISANIDGFKIFPHFLPVSISVQLKPNSFQAILVAQSQILGLVFVVR